MTINELSNSRLLDELQRRLSLSEQTINEQQSMLNQLKTLNKKLEQSEALKTHFISNIKNEINNPLASILALSQNILRKTGVLAPDVQKSLRLIYNEAHALEFQLSNIMAAAEIEAGQAAPQPVSVNTTHATQQVVASFSDPASRKRVTVEVIAEADIQFVTDIHFFKIIISNLVSNAIKFSREGAMVMVKLEHQIEKLSVIVTDTGIGIGNEDQPRIFDRFTQLDSGTVKRYLGHGLGLSVTKDLVALLDGTISVTSGAAGSSFEVTLPVRQSDDGVSGIFGMDDEITLFDKAF